MDQLSTLKSKMKQDTTLQHPSTSSVTPDMSKDPSPAPKSQMTDWMLYYRCKRQTPFANTSQRLLNGKAPKHETDVFTYSKGLLYKHVTESGKQFLALVIPKSWKYMVLVEAHDKLHHQGNTCTYFLIKRQYYWKGMNKDIRKYTTTCALCHREKAQTSAIPLANDRNTR